MRNLHAPRLEDQGAVTIGAHHYWVQHYYPNGGSQYIVYVYKRGHLSQRGLTFTTDHAFQAWLSKQPKQADLFGSD